MNDLRLRFVFVIQAILISTAFASLKGVEAQRAQAVGVNTTTMLEDLVVVFGTNAQDDHVSIAKASRAWRKVRVRAKTAGPCTVSSEDTLD